MSQEIISKFNERPKTKIAWWAMGLGLVLIFSPTFFGIFAAAINPQIAKATNDNVASTIGLSLVILLFVTLISAFTTGFLALKKGERSFAVWLGFIPAILALAFWLFMIIGEFIFPH